jgi:hypothetical protein
VVPDPVGVGCAAGSWLDDDEVEPQRQTGERFAIGELAAVKQPVGRGTDPRPLAVIDGLLGQPERPIRPPAYLDDDERGRGARVDRHEIEFVATDMDVPGQDGPSDGVEVRRDQRLGGITGLLRRGPSRPERRILHAAILTSAA